MNSHVDKCDTSRYFFIQKNRISATYPKLEPLEAVKYETTMKHISEGELPQLIS
jgi:hypothetical protein